MNYLSKIKSNESDYRCYQDIKEVLRNTYQELKINYAKNNQLTFSRSDEKIVYSLYEKNGKPKFKITNKDTETINCALTQLNLKKILEAIDQTRPITINKSCMLFNSKLCNRYSTKRFDETYLLSMAPWKSATQEKGKNTYVLPDGYVYKGDSQSEIKILNHLVTKGCASLIRGQDYAISYDDHTYYPDFVYLNHLNQIVILEVKGKSDFSTEKNLTKYIAMAIHCHEKGYVYGIIDQDFVTMKSFFNLKQTKSYEKAVLSVLKAEGTFNSQALTKLRSSSFSHLKRSHLMKLTTKLIIENRLINRPKTVHDLNIINEKLKVDKYYMIKSNCY